LAARHKFFKQGEPAMAITALMVKDLRENPAQA
jgi:hypothetical protein